MSTWNTIASIISGLIVVIPVVIALVMKTVALVKTSNWTQLVGIVAGYMAKAETLMENGETRKEWVLGMLHQSSEVAAFNLTEEQWSQVSEMIDELCTMAKSVNSGTTTAT